MNTKISLEYFGVFRYSYFYFRNYFDWQWRTSNKKQQNNGKYREMKHLKREIIKMQY
jgi:hypothetical protein